MSTVDLPPFVNDAKALHLKKLDEELIWLTNFQPKTLEAMAQKKKLIDKTASEMERLKR